MNLLNQFKAASLLSLISVSVFAQTAIDLEPPTYKAGDTWTWAVKVSPRDQCTTSILPGAKTTHTVEKVTDMNYRVAVLGPNTGQSFTRGLNKDLTFSSTTNTGNTANDVTVKSKLLNFPLKADDAWDTSLAGGNVVTTLNCKVAKAESLAINGQELQVTPVVCTGRWKNLSSGNNNQSIYKYWYSPKVGNFVRQTVFTYWERGTCVDVEWQLESYKLAD